KVHKWNFEPRVPIHVQAAQLTRLVKLWLLPNQTTPEEVEEKVTIDCVLLTLPRLHRHPVGLTNPWTMNYLVEAAELSEATLAKDSGITSGRGNICSNPSRPNKACMTSRHNPCEFQPGDKVLILTLDTSYKFLTSWKGPYTVPLLSLLAL
ncbi:hypothetical protein M9458_000560, partial [Cirrhinus mrigala]